MLRYFVVPPGNRETWGRGDVMVYQTFVTSGVIYFTIITNNNSYETIIKTK